MDCFFDETDLFLRMFSDIFANFLQLVTFFGKGSFRGVPFNFGEDLMMVFRDRRRNSSINDGKSPAIAAFAWICIVDTIL